MANREEEISRITLGDAPAGLVRTCKKCGLSVPTTVNACPNDGTVLVDEIKIGSRLMGRYEFLEVLGEGGMSVVYKTRHPDLDKVVAVKMMHSHMIGPQAAGRFRQEAQSASKLDHRNVIRIYDFGATPEGQPFMVMEYLNGDDLGKIVRKTGPLEPLAAVDLFLQVCDGLSHAHKNSVLHRDLKPSNIVLCKDSDGKTEAKLVDFGIAKVVAEGSEEGKQLTRTGEVLGSPPYMSPEQCKGMQLDARADIYSLGCLMFETLTGRPPFCGSNFMEIMFKHLEETAPSMRSVNNETTFPPALEAIIARCLHKARADRYQTVDELRAALVEARADIINPERSRSGGVNKLLLATIVGALLVAAGVGAFMLMPAQKSAPAVVKPLAADFLDDNGNMTNTLEIVYRTNPGATELHPMSDADMSLIHKFKSLRALNASDSTITDAGLKMLGESKLRLDALKLNNSVRISDSGIRYLASLPLSILEIQQMGIGDEAMGYVSRIKSLVNLQAAKLPVSDVGVARLTQLPKLEVLDLTMTQVSDEGLKELAKIKTLRSLDLEGIQTIDGSGLPNLAPLKQLEFLRLKFLGLKPGSLKTLPLFPKLDTLDIEDSSISDADLAGLDRLPSLENLDIGDNARLTGKCLTYLRNCKKLRDLDVSRNGFTAADLMQLKGMKSLERVNLKSCPQISAADVDLLRKNFPTVSFKSGD